MATKEIFLTPHPSGDGTVERVGVTESQGPGDAGRVVALGDNGLIGDSLLSFSGAPDMVISEYDAGKLLAQTVTDSGLEWRFTGMSSFADWLSVRVMDAAAPVGTVRNAFSSVDTDYWLYLDGRQVGSSNSGASLSGNRYKALYVYLWNAISGTYALLLYNSLGQEVTRGPSALADWDADRRLALPDMRDRVIVGIGTGYSMGQTGGAKTVTLAMDDIPPHNMTVRTAQTGAAELVEFVTNATADTVVSSTPRNIAAVTQVQVQILAAGTGPHVHPVSVSVLGGKVEKHKHPITVAEAVAGDHLHDVVTEVAVEVVADPEITDTTLTATATTVNTVSGPTGELPHLHSADSGDPGAHEETHAHQSTASTLPQTTETQHMHGTQSQATTQVNFSMQSTAQTTLQLTKVKKTITTVGEGSASTNTVGGGGPHENMPPFRALAVLIRY